MAKSFFERLTGSVRVKDGEDITAEKPEVAKKPAKTRETKSKKESVGQELLTESPVDELSVLANPPARESRMERRFFASREEKPEPEEIAVEEEGDEVEGELNLDIFDDGGNFIVQSMVAGVHPEDIDISFNEDTLIIRGVRRQQSEMRNENYYTKELYWGKFSRSVVLPGEVDSEKVEATLKNGLLTLKIPKKSYAGVRKIKIKSE